MYLWTLLALVFCFPHSTLAETTKRLSHAKSQEKQGKPAPPPLPMLENKGKRLPSKQKRKPASEAEGSTAPKQSFLSDLGVEVQIEGAYHLVNASEKSVTATASLVSELSPRFNIGVEKDFKLFTLGLEGGMDQRSYSTIPGVNTSGLSHSLISLGVKFGRNWMPGFSTELIPFFGGQTIFFRIDARSMKAVALNSFGGMLSLFYSYSLPFKLVGLIRAPSTLKPITATLGYGASGYLGLGLKIKRLQAGVGVMGAYEKRPATLLSFDTISLGARITASYTF
jgi:hypothetical protein